MVSVAGFVSIKHEDLQKVSFNEERIIFYYFDPEKNEDTQLQIDLWEYKDTIIAPLVNALKYKYGTKFFAEKAAA
ncbi:MAG: hypothetical protein ACLFR2_09910 [Candidatus Kapaibacterium sp.]